MKVLLSWVIAILLLASSKADEPDADQVRLAYDSFVGKFKKPGGPDGFALTNIGGFWQTIETTEVFIDAYERFKDDTSKQNMIDVVDSWINGQGENWEWNDYNDDLMWGVIMYTRAYLILGTQRYLDAAKTNFQIVWDRAWTDSFGGGLLWYHGKTSKNACVNGPGAVAACLLAIATGDDSYYNKAEDIIRWMNQVLVQQDGGVWDNVDWDSANNKNTYNTWVSTYNQGTYIGACFLLYQHNNNNDYLDMAKRAAERCTRFSEILDGEDVGGDLIGFKGILGRWLGYFVRQTGITDYNVWIQNNVRTVWNNRNSDNLMWTNFARKTEDNLENSDNDDKKYETAWGCSSALSWLINFAAL